MSLQQQLLFIESGELKSKLCSILVSLQQENQDLKRSHSNKISNLETQIIYKDKQIVQLTNKINQNQKKYQTLEWKILQKDNIIEDLTNKLKNIQSKFKQRLHTYIDRIDLTTNDEQLTPALNRKNTQQTNKRINISQYFIKAIQSSKVSTKVDGDAPSEVSSSLQSYIIPPKLVFTQSSDTSGCGRLNLKTPPSKLQKVRSLEKDSFMKESDWRFQDNVHENQRKDEEKTGKKIIVNKNTGIEDNLLLRKNIQNPQIIKQYGYLKERQKQRDRQIQNMTQNKKFEQKRPVVLQQKWKKLSAFQQKNNQPSNILFYK